MSAPARVPQRASVLCVALLSAAAALATVVDASSLELQAPLLLPRFEQQQQQIYSARIHHKPHSPPLNAHTRNSTLQTSNATTTTTTTNDTPTHISTRQRRTKTLAAAINGATSDRNAEKLYEDLMNVYNKYVRPVKEPREILIVKINLSLAQIIEVEWFDSKLKWDPDDYGGIRKLHIPATDIWRPDIVLYNNADGDYVITTFNKATVHFDGHVEWTPPAIYKSSCSIDVSYFPFDTQTCVFKFGTWSYNGNFIELRHLKQPDVNTTNSSSTYIENGIDLEEFSLSVEWDVISATAIRHELGYSCCVGGFYDVTFYLEIRRKPLFYTVNLIVPCVVMSFLSILVFYMPANSYEKVSITISIVVSVDVFLLALIEMIPPTSVVVSLLGKYLIFTLCLVTLSVCMTIYVLNISFRNSSSHKMSRFERRFFLQLLPPLLLMKARNSSDEFADEMANTRFVHCYNDADNDACNDVAGIVCRCGGVDYFDDGDETTRATQQAAIHSSQQHKRLSNTSASAANTAPLNKRHANKRAKHHNRRHRRRRRSSSAATCESACASHAHAALFFNDAAKDDERLAEEQQQQQQKAVSLCGMHREVTNAFLSLDFVAKRMENRENFVLIEEDWRYMSTVVDRLLLLLFTVVWFVGTAVILLQAPTLYDSKQPIDVELSKFAALRNTHAAAVGQAASW